MRRRRLVMVCAIGRWRLADNASGAPGEKWRVRTRQQALQGHVVI